MSPEQINEANYNEKTDIWSLGCVLYEMVSLKPPFTATNHIALANKILQGDFERIPDRYSEDLYQAIKMMLSVESSKRPTVTELMSLKIVKMRIKEKEMRSEYQKIKKREADVTKKMENLQAKEAEL